MDSQHHAQLFGSRRPKRSDLLDITKTSTADFLRALEELNFSQVSSKASTAVDSGVVYDPDGEIRVEDNEVPLVVAPPDIRANDVTFGMKEERIALEKRLSPSPETEETTQGVLIWSPAPGSGKTHLARDIFFANPEAYPGGSFWIDARSRGDIVNSFWDIATTAGIYEASPTSQNEPRRTSPPSLEGVKRWLLGRRRWLMVFDGLNFDRNLTIEDFRILLPRGKGCSIIFTSIDRSLEASLGDLIGHTVEVPPLPHADGISLLAWAMDMPDPSHLLQFDEIYTVERLNCQPLAICTYGRNIKIVRESQTRLQSGELDPGFSDLYGKVIAFLQADHPQEVLYLIYLLAFFGQRIPFALVQRGAESLGILSVRIDSIKTLVAHKILSMESVDESLPRTPTSLKRNRRLSFHDQTAQRLDFISIREEVQVLIRDILANNPQDYQYWLLAATSLFCLAFRSAAIDVSGTPELALSKRDLAVFEAHGNSLRIHYGTKNHDFRHREAFDALTNLEMTLAQIGQAINDVDTGSTGDVLTSPSVFSDVFQDFNFETTVEEKMKLTKHDTSKGRTKARSPRTAWGKVPFYVTEPPLKPGMRRLRWKCVCGKGLFDDYLEIEPGSLDRLEKQLRRHNNGPWREKGSLESLFRGFTIASQSLLESWNTFTRALSQKGQPSALPTYAAHPAPNALSQSMRDPMYLLMCINHTVPGSKLHQQTIRGDHIRTDRDLFYLLRQTYFERRTHLRSFLCLRKVKRLSLVKFLVDLSEVVDTNFHSHNTSCGPTRNDCTCTPPSDLIVPSTTAEYMLRHPLKYVPAVGSNFLTHKFQHPECVNAEETWVYNQVPKRIGSRLESTPNNSPLLGWGVGFEEGWDESKVKHGGFLIFVVSSLIFAVLWSIFKHDVNGAFAISAYWMTGLAIVLGYVATFPK